MNPCWCNPAFKSFYLSLFMWFFNNLFITVETYILSPVVRSEQLCSHLAVVITVFLHGRCGYRQLTEQVNQPRETGNATECWETKPRLQRSTLNQLQRKAIITTFLYWHSAWGPTLTCGSFCSLWGQLSLYWFKLIEVSKWPESLTSKM